MQLTNLGAFREAGWQDMMGGEGEKKGAMKRKKEEEEMTTQGQGRGRVKVW